MEQSPFNGIKPSLNASTYGAFVHIVGESFYPIAKVSLISIIHLAFRLCLSPLRVFLLLKVFSHAFAFAPSSAHGGQSVLSYAYLYPYWN
jgi:hypothetical protein